jgi:hypothetical protein
MFDKKMLFDIVMGTNDYNVFARPPALDSRHAEKIYEIAEKKPEIIIKHIARGFASLTLEDLTSYANKTGKGDMFTFDRRGFVNLCITQFCELGGFSLLLYAAGKRGISPAAYLSKVTELAARRAEEVFPLTAGETAGRPPVYDDRVIMDEFSRPHDKVVQRLENMQADEWAAGGFRVDEKIKGKPGVITAVNLGLETFKAMGYSNITPFDFTVLYTGLSLYHAGRREVSLNTVYRALTGKGTDDFPTAKMKAEIFNSIRKLAVVQVTITANGICEHYGLPKNEGPWEIDYLLPVKIIGEGDLNGGKADCIIQFTHESGFMKLARIKKQILTYDVSLHNVLGVNMSAMNITVIHYLLGRIEACKNNRMHKTIVIDSAIAATQYGGTRGRFVGLVEKCFAYWGRVGYIGGYELRKKGKKVDAVIFSDAPKKVSQ